MSPGLLDRAPSPTAPRCSGNIQVLRRTMRTVRTCDSCGFENAEEGRACALCGASEVTAVRSPAGEVETLDRPAVGFSPAAHASPIGLVYADRYRVEALLGAGGMGAVYRAHDVLEERDVALKVLHPTGDDDQNRNERFKREIEVLSKIQHAAVPRILGWGARDNQPYFVSELVEGHDLKLDIQRRGLWAPAEAAALAATVADALAAAHAVGIVHRDVKPGNIMIGEDDSVSLLDFGLARGVGIDMISLTRTGMIVGTPGYMSPEQFEGIDVDERTDIYSLGIVLFELLTARLPFMAKTPIGVALKHRTEPPPPPRTLHPDIPAWLERVVLRCLEKDPALRFGSAVALAGELRRPRSSVGSRSFRLASGDLVIEDDSDATDWALVLATPGERTDWKQGMALRFRERFYKLEEIVPPTRRSGSWGYRFGFFPETEILRRPVDYEQDCAERAAERESSLPSKLQRWISRSRT